MLFRSRLREQRPQLRRIRERALHARQQGRQYQHDLTTAGALRARQLRQSFGLTVPVAVVRPGTLPRFEVKARRFVIER